MKEIPLKNGKTIRTPWLRVDEAAAYCGVVRSTFEERCRELPHGGSRKLRLYHVTVLDAWLKGELEVSFDRDPEDDTGRRPRRRVRRSGEMRHLILPQTGEIFPIKTGDS